MGREDDWQHVSRMWVMFLIRMSWVINVCWVIKRMSHVRNRTKINVVNVLQWGCLSIIFFVFPFIGIFLLHHIVNIESFPRITRFDPVTDFNQDQLPCFSHSDQPLSYVTWVQIDDLIVMDLNWIGTGHAILTYVDVNKCGCSFLYSNKPCTSSHDRCILSKSKWWTGSSSRRVKGVNRDHR